MLRKNRRIQKKLFPKPSSGKLFATSNFSMRVVLSNAIKTPRFAVVVSKKVFSQANKRNYLKRLIYSEIAKISTLNKGVFVMIYAKNGAGMLNSKEVSKEIRELLTKIFV
jgi:ribonuclease P protein component